MTNLRSTLRITFIIVSSNSGVGTCAQKIASRTLQLALGPANILKAALNAHRRRLLLYAFLIFGDVTAHAILIFLKYSNLNSYWMEKHKKI